VGEHADEKAIEAIYNYRPLSEQLATAGQPTEEQLAAIARAGYEVVINLGLSGERYSLPDERGLVESLGLEYVHIPVLWEQPTRSDLEQFFEAMDAHQQRKLFVHCAANYRVSAFVALYSIIRLGRPPEEALRDVRTMRFPEWWQQFIDEVLHEHAHAAASHTRRKHP
jgi:uncharacterized protein (TIGR01244 family)